MKRAIMIGAAMAYLIHTSSANSDSMASISSGRRSKFVKFRSRLGDAVSDRYRIARIQDVKARRVTPCARINDSGDASVSSIDSRAFYEQLWA